MPARPRPAALPAPAVPRPARVQGSPTRLLARPARAAGLAATVLLAAVLTGCGGDPVVEETDAPVAATSAREAPQQVPSAAAEKSPEHSPGDSPAETPSQDPLPALVSTAADEPLTATLVRRTWPDADWEITDLPGDACAGTLPEATDWALGEDYFRCGAPDKRLLVCRAVEGGEKDEALCVRDPLGRDAVRIRSAGVDSFTAFASEMPYPLVVELEDGTTCAASLRDDMEHHTGRQSWIHCGEDSALLLDQASATVYFDRDEPVWTAQLARGRDAPVEVRVREVHFAASAEDMAQYGFAQGWDGTERD